MKPETIPADLSHRTARKAERIAAAGALVVMAAFSLALWQLHALGREVSARKQDLLHLNNELKRVEAEKQKLFEENATLRKQRSQLKQNNQDLEHVVLLQQSRDYAGALKKINEILTRDSENEVASCYAAHSCYQLGHYSEAVAYAKKSIAVDANYFDPYVPLICALTKTGNREEAVKYLKFLLNAHPENLTDLIARKRYYDDLWNAKECRDTIVIHQRRLESIQKSLKALGYYRSTVDAIVGADTLSAIQRLCAARGITNNMTVDALLDQLRMVPNVEK